MTNPIEYIDKKKLLTHLELRKAHYARVDQPGKYSELDSVIQEIESGTFDDHTAQEEMAKLKESMSEITAKHHLLESVCADYEKVCDTYKRDLDKCHQERDALLETMKRIVRNIGNGDYGTAKDAARSTIAEIEGNKPNDTPTT